MGKSVKGDLIIGNYIIEATQHGKNEVNVYEALKFCKDVDTKIRANNFFVKYSPNDIIDFSETYSNFVSMWADCYTIKMRDNDKERTLEKQKTFFRIGLPEVIIDTVLSISDTINW